MQSYLANDQHININNIVCR